MSFAELGLSPAIVRALEEEGYTAPTPIQKEAIPAVLEGRDLLAAAQTGTGKTAGFTLPLLQRISMIDFARENRRARIRVLILTPTRELAAQVEESVRTYGRYLDVRSMVMFGGVNIRPQIERLNKRVDILVATPGRLLDHVGQRTIDLSGIDTLVLDEADRMLDMGFIRDIRRILPLLPADRQNLLFSATFSDEIKSLAAGILNEPIHIEVARRNAPADTVRQVVHPVDRDRKRPMLEKIIREGQWEQVLVFTRTKHGANRLAEYLTEAGIPAMAIHGNKSQSARERALGEFKAGQLRVLVATDIAARGIDIDALPHVVNYELPNTAEDYVHRIGRTGRAGCVGEAISLVCVDEHKLLADIEKLMKRKLPSEIIPGFEPDPNAVPEPIRKLRPQGQGRQGGNGQGRSQGNNGQARPQQKSSRPQQGSSRSEAPQRDGSASAVNRAGNGPRRDNRTGGQDGGQRSGPRDNAASRDNAGNRENFGNRDNAGNRDNFANRDNRGNRENYASRDNRGNRDTQGNRDNFGNRENFGNRDSQVNRDGAGNRSSNYRGSNAQGATQAGGRRDGGHGSSGPGGSGRGSSDHGRAGAQGAPANRGGQGHARPRQNARPGQNRSGPGR